MTDPAQTMLRQLLDEYTQSTTDGDRNAQP